MPCNVFKATFGVLESRHFNLLLLLIIISMKKATGTEDICFNFLFIAFVILIAVVTIITAQGIDKGIHREKREGDTR